MSLLKFSLGSSIPTPIVRALGAIILIGAISLLAWNERRMTLPFFAHTATSVNANSPEPIDRTTYVAATGLLTAAVDLGDPPFLPPSPFVVVRRRVEMYAWAERFDEGNGLARYEEEWTENPADTSSFQQPTGHVNPPKPLASKFFAVPSAKVGIFDVNVSALRMPSLRPLQLTPTLPASLGTIADNAIFRGKGTPDAPHIGDIRIQYDVLPQGSIVTLFGGALERNIAPFTHPNGFVSYHLFHGPLPEALVRIDREADPFLWPLRTIGMLFVWLALWMLTPLTRLSACIQFLETLPRLLRPAALLPVAIVVTIILVLLLDLLFTVWIGIAIAGALVLGLLLLEQKLVASMPVSVAAPVPVTAASLAQLPSAQLTLENLSTAPVAPIVAPQVTPAMVQPPTLAAASLENLPRTHAEPAVDELPVTIPKSAKNPKKPRKTTKKKR